MLLNHILTDWVNVLHCTFTSNGMPFFHTVYATA